MIVKVGRSEGGDRYKAASSAPVAPTVARFATAPGAIGADIVALKTALVALDDAKAAIERALVARKGSSPLTRRSARPSPTPKPSGKRRNLEATARGSPSFVSE